MLFWKYLEYVPPNITQLQKTKDDSFFMIHNFLYFRCAKNCNDKCRIICKKMKMRPLNITFLHKSLYIIGIKNMKSLFLQKNLTTKMIKVPCSP